MQSPDYFVKKSPIHGKGLFANREFYEGDIIGCFDGTPTTKNSKYVLWLDEESAILVTNDLKYANHSKKPNAEVHGTTLYALTTILPQDEITFDYGADWD